MKDSWTPVEFDYMELDKNKNKIHEIIKGEKPALIIKKFFDPKLCKVAVNKAKEYSNIEDENKIFKKIGVSLLSFLTRKSDYFSQAEEARSIFHSIFEGIEDPRKKIHHLLSEIFPGKTVTVAKEGRRKYACGVIRLHELGDYAQIHRDCVKFEAPNYDVSNLSNQLSTVLYLQQSEKGGDLVIYKKIWNKSSERYREIDFGYSRKVLDGCKQSVRIKPRQGDLIIINPIHFHEILPVSGHRKRVTLGLFLGFSKYGKSVLTWT